MSCKGHGPLEHHCLGADRNVSGLFSMLVVGHMIAHKSQAYPLDFGIAPWPVNTVALNKVRFMKSKHARMHLGRYCSHLSED
jgi:hypothetical protein